MASARSLVAAPRRDVIPGIASGIIASGVQGASDRTYYRVRCAGEVYGELYYDAVGARWVLDRIYD